MATSELDTTPVEWKVVRENLVQLHCEDVLGTSYRQDST